MRSLVATGLVLLGVARGPAVRADPSSPQIDPRHAQREDARRLTEPLRELERQPSEHSREVAVQSSPADATIRIDDGPPIGTTPMRLTMPTGHHVITVEKSGFQVQSHPIDVGASGADLHFILPAAESRPLIRRWWFWPAVAVVTATAIGLAYGATREPEPRLPGVTCDTSGCHP